MNLALVSVLPKCVFLTLIQWHHCGLQSLIPEQAQLQLCAGSFSHFKLYSLYNQEFARDFKCIRNSDVNPYKHKMKIQILQALILAKKKKFSLSWVGHELRTICHHNFELLDLGMLFGLVLMFLKPNFSCLL